MFTLYVDIINHYKNIATEISITDFTNKLVNKNIPTTSKQN